MAPPEPSAPYAGGPAPKPAPSRDEIIAAAQGHFMQLRMYDRYLSAVTELRRHVPEKDVEAADEMLGRLLTQNALLALLTTFLHSPFVTPETRTYLGLRRKQAKVANTVTIYALATTLWKELHGHSSVDSARGVINRIVEAAFFFKLIEKAEGGRENYKPLRGTRKLCDLMVASGIAAALVAREAGRDPGPEEGGTVE